MTKRKTGRVVATVPMAETPWQMVKRWRVSTFLYSPLYEVPGVFGTVLRAAIQAATVVLVLRAMGVLK